MENVKYKLIQHILNFIFWLRLSTKKIIDEYIW